MMVRPSWAGAAFIALFLAIVVVLDSSSTVMHLRICHTLQRGRTLSPVPACGAFLQIPCLSALMHSKANRKHDITVQKNYLHEEVEQQQDHVIGARIDR